MIKFGKTWVEIKDELDKRINDPFNASTITRLLYDATITNDDYVQENDRIVYSLQFFLNRYTNLYNDLVNNILPLSSKKILVTPIIELVSTTDENIILRCLSPDFSIFDDLIAVWNVNGTIFTGNEIYINKNLAKTFPIYCYTYTRRYLAKSKEAVFKYTEDLLPSFTVTIDKTFVDSGVKTPLEIVVNGITPEYFNVIAKYGILEHIGGTSYELTSYAVETSYDYLIYELYYNGKLYRGEIEITVSTPSETNYNIIDTYITLCGNKKVIKLVLPCLNPNQIIETSNVNSIVKDTFIIVDDTIPTLDINIIDTQTGQTLTQTLTNLTPDNIVTLTPTVLNIESDNDVLQITLANAPVPFSIDYVSNNYGLNLISEFSPDLNTKILYFDTTNYTGNYDTFIMEYHLFSYTLSTYCVKTETISNLILNTKNIYHGKKPEYLSHHTWNLPRNFNDIAVITNVPVLETYVYLFDKNKTFKFKFIADAVERINNVLLVVTNQIGYLINIDTLNVYQIPVESIVSVSSNKHSFYIIDNLNRFIVIPTSLESFIRIYDSQINPTKVSVINDNEFIISNNTLYKLNKDFEFVSYGTYDLKDGIGLGTNELINMYFNTKVTLTYDEIISVSFSTRYVLFTEGNATKILDFVTGNVYSITKPQYIDVTFLDSNIFVQNELLYVTYPISEGTYYFYDDTIQIVKESQVSVQQITPVTSTNNFIREEFTVVPSSLDIEVIQ